MNKAYFPLSFTLVNYPQLNLHCRIPPATNNPVRRLRFVALAFVWVNLWVFLLWTHSGITQRGGGQILPHLCRLKILLEFLSHVVEQHFPKRYGKPQFDQVTPNA